MNNDAKTTNRGRTHFDTGYAWGATPCGKSLHGWANIGRAKPMNVTRVARDVTCKRCLAKMAR